MTTLAELPDPGRVTRVVLDGLGEPLDVSGDHLAVSAGPLTIGLCLDASITEDRLRSARLRLAFQDWRAPHRARGLLALRVREALALPGTSRRLWMFDVAGSRNYCLPWFHRRAPALDVYYMRPRPVSLVSVMHGGESDAFTIDWTGALSSGHFVLALPSNTPAIRLMRQSRRIAVSAVPASFTPLGPFATVTSMEFALPVPRDALLVREVEICAAHPIHSHTVFVTAIARLTCSTDDDALCRWNPCGSDSTPGISLA